MTATIRVEGLEHLTGRLNDSLVNGPVTRFLTRGAILVRNTAVETVNVDTGRVKQSIAYELDGTPARTAIVGTNVDYAPNLEAGTPPHVVPPSDLEGWARRTGFPGGGAGISRVIARRGTKAHPFLLPALESNRGAIQALVPVLAREIEQEAERG